MTDGTFGVDPGPAYRPDREGDGPPPDGGAPPAGLVPADVEGVSQVAVEGLLTGWFTLLHFTAGRGGPPDAFQPTPGELAQMARPAADWAGQHARAAALVERAGAPAGAVVAIGAYHAQEFRRVAEFRAARDAQAAAEAAGVPDAALSDLGTSGVDPGAAPWRRTTGRPNLGGDGG